MHRDGHKKPTIILIECEDCGKKLQREMIKLINDEDFLILLKKFRAVRVSKHRANLPKRHAHIFMSKGRKPHGVRGGRREIISRMRKMLGDKAPNLERVKEDFKKIDALDNKEKVLKNKISNSKRRNRHAGKEEGELRDLNKNRKQRIERLKKRFKGTPRGKERMRKTPVTQGQWREYYTFKSNVFHVE